MVRKIIFGQIEPINIFQLRNSKMNMKNNTSFKLMG